MWTLGEGSLNRCLYEDTEESVSATVKEQVRADALFWSQQKVGGTSFQQNGNRVTQGLPIPVRR